jgi:hypothetical protein
MGFGCYGAQKTAFIVLRRHRGLPAGAAACLFHYVDLERSINDADRIKHILSEIVPTFKSIQLQPKQSFEVKRVIRMPEHIRKRKQNAAGTSN